MRIQRYVLFGSFFFFFLLVDVLTFGALARQPAVGADIARAAATQAPISQTYIALGTPLVSRAPVLQAVGESMAGAAFGDSYPAIEARPDAAIELLFSESRGPLSALFMLSYWGAPLSLLLTLAAWMFRSRRTHLIKSVRR